MIENIQFILAVAINTQFKVGIEYKFLRECALRTIFIVMHNSYQQKHVFSNSWLDELIKLYDSIKHDSIDDEFKKLLKPILDYLIRQNLADNDLSKASKYISSVRLINCYDDQLQHLYESYLQQGKYIIEKLSTDNRDFFIIFCVGGIGDVVIPASFSYILQRRAGKSQTCLVLPKKYQSLGRMFDNIQRIIVIPNEDMELIRFYCTTEKIFDGDNWTYGMFKTYNANNDLMINVNYGIVDNYRARFNLPIDTPTNKIVVGQIANLDQYQFDERSIIFFPLANTLKIDLCNAEFWKSLADKLKSLGYKIFTNCGPDELPIDGTIPLQVNLQEIYQASEKVRCCVGVRSGVFDWISFADSKIISLSHNNYRTFNLFSLENTFKRPGLKEICVEESTKSIDLQNEIISLIQGNF